ncbi:MAG: hypothetical protein H6835_08910 [Planctomycetes bacterium]|nr:hypothetical protein [Planctomycetota bacterium]
MASSPPEADSDAAFALRELAACWNQAFEAIGQGDLDRVENLLELADEQLVAAGDGTVDTPAEAALRGEATLAFARLQHAMKAGMDGIRDELARARKGQKALRGYGGDRGDHRVRASV